MAETNQEIFGQRLSDRRKDCGLTQKDLAKRAAVSVTSIQNYENGQIPGGDILLRVAIALSCTTDWLLTGDGKIERDGALFVGPATARKLMEGGEAAGELATRLRAGADQQRPEAVHYNGNAPTRRDISIADMLAKTARVLESDTVYREALYSNIEAFHHGVTMDERLSKMDSKFDQVTQRLDALEAENQQLRQELEQSRAGSALSDTG